MSNARMMLQNQSIDLDSAKEHIDRSYRYKARFLRDLGDRMHKIERYVDALEATFGAHQDLEGIRSTTAQVLRDCNDVRSKHDTFFKLIKVRFKKIATGIGFMRHGVRST